MKKNVIIIGFILIFLLIGLSGCTEKQTSNEKTSSEQTEKQVTPPIEESITTILSKTETIDSMYYEIDASIEMSEFGIQHALIKIWQKTPYLKEQIISDYNGISNSILVINCPDGTYIYDNDKETYIMTMEDVSFFSASLQYFDSALIKTYLGNESLNTYDTEIIDGKQATIIEYSPMQDNNFVRIKMWIWNDKGVPLKALIDMTMEDMTMAMDFTFTNYSFTEISDSTFRVS